VPPATYSMIAETWHGLRGHDPGQAGRRNASPATPRAVHDHLPTYH
jgi:hypothetical protein